MNEVLKSLIERGYDEGIVEIIDSPHNDGAVCKVGEEWFYFGGRNAMERKAAE